jgi:hypothetical protein
MKRLKTSGRVRLTVAAAAVGLLASLGGVGYAAGLVHVKHSSPTSAQYPPSKVTICHHTHSQKNPFVTITVSEHAVPAHLRHGDTIGACSEQQGAAATKKHGKAPKVHQNRGHHGDKSQGAAKGKSGGNHGLAKGHSKTHGPSAVHGQGQGKGHTPQGNGPQGHGKGLGKSHGQGQGQGQGHGQSHGPDAKHGNSGTGGKGNGHKP